MCTTLFGGVRARTQATPASWVKRRGRWLFRREHKSAATSRKRIRAGIEEAGWGGRTVEQERVGVEHELVARVCDERRNLPRRLELAELQEALVLLDGLSDELGGAGLSLGLDDDALLLLERLVDEVRRALGRLLRDLLRLDRVREGGRERDVRDRDVVELDVEPARAALERVLYEARDHLALGDELAVGLDGWGGWCEVRRWAEGWVGSGRRSEVPPLRRQRTSAASRTGFVG